MENEREELSEDGSHQEEGYQERERERELALAGKTKQAEGGCWQTADCGTSGVLEHQLTFVEPVPVPISQSSFLQKGCDRLQSAAWPAAEWRELERKQPPEPELPMSHAKGFFLSPLLITFMKAMFLLHVTLPLLEY